MDVNDISNAFSRSVVYIYELMDLDVNMWFSFEVFVSFVEYYCMWYLVCGTGKSWKYRLEWYITLYQMNDSLQSCSLFISSSYLHISNFLYVYNLYGQQGKRLLICIPMKTSTCEDTHLSLSTHCVEAPSLEMAHPEASCKCRPIRLSIEIQAWQMTAFSFSCTLSIVLAMQCGTLRFSFSTSFTSVDTPTCKSGRKQSIEMKGVNKTSGQISRHQF